MIQKSLSKKIMPIFKTKIFNQIIDLNYQEEDKSKLLNIVDNLNEHWIKYDNLKGKVSDIKILILLTIELQDALLDLNNKSNKSNNENLNLNSKNKEIKNLTKELILHKDKINKLEAELKNSNIEFKEVNEILDDINSELKGLSKSIIKSYEN